MEASPRKKRCFSHLSYEERVAIECLRNQGYSLRYIAHLLNRSPSSLCREVTQKRVNGIYGAKKAHMKSYQRRYWSKYQSYKALPYAPFIEEKLVLRWSPERIAGYLGRGGIHLSPKAVYTFIYSRCLERYLWRPKKRGGHRPLYLRDTRVFVDRKPVVETGHWEMDFVVSSSNTCCLLVAVDRYSRLTVIQKLEDKAHASVISAFEFFARQHRVTTVIVDNDIAFGCWRELETRCGCAIFFTHPYRSWEKPLVEQTNKLIRQFIPKKTNLKTVSCKKLGDVHRFLNQTPRQCLDYLTTYEKHYSV